MTNMDHKRPTCSNYESEEEFMAATNFRKGVEYYYAWSYYKNIGRIK